MDGTATISLDTLDELREKAEEARLATNRSKKFTSKLMDCYEFDTEKYNKSRRFFCNLANSEWFQLSDPFAILFYRRF